MKQEQDKKEIIEKIIQAMESEGEFVYYNKELTSSQKLTQADVLLDVIKFLKDYDKNVKILNEYKYNHRFDVER